MYQAFMTYVVYPLALKAAGMAWNMAKNIYNSYVLKGIDKKYSEHDEAREIILKSIEGAKTNEERRNLSVVLAEFNRLSDSRSKTDS